MSNELTDIIYNSSISELKDKINTQVLRIKKLEWIANFIFIEEQESEEKMELIFMSRIKITKEYEKKIKQEFEEIKKLVFDYPMFSDASIYSMVNEAKEKPSYVMKAAESMYSEFEMEYREDIINYVIIKERQKLKELEKEFEKEIKLLNSKIYRNARKKNT